MVGKKLYVGNLTYRVSSSDLEQLFSQFGSVQSAEVISDRDTGRSKGFGFVEMSNDNEARAAIDSLNDQEHDGRRLTVNEARPREPRTGGGGGGGGGGWRRTWRAERRLRSLLIGHRSFQSASQLDTLIQATQERRSPRMLLRSFGY